MDARTAKILKEGIRRPTEIPSYLTANALTRFEKLRKPSQLPLYRGIQKEENYLLIVLDACRYDYLRKHFNTYFDGNLRAVFSAASHTFEYVRKVWPEYYELTYVTAATPINTSVTHLEEADETPEGLNRDVERLRELYQGYAPVDHFEEIVEVWRTDWDESLGVTPPEAVTDVAVEHASVTDRMVAHYFQPHTPYIGESVRYEENQPSVQTEEATVDELPDLYEANVERVLPEVARLIEHTEFEKYVITGDHGEGLGEFGGTFHGMSHHPKVRIVPWATVDEVRKSADSPSEKEADKKGTDKGVVERLTDLGYLEG
jgi:hypothetical protein